MQNHVTGFDLMIVTPIGGPFRHDMHMSDVSVRLEGQLIVVGGLICPLIMRYIH